MEINPVHLLNHQIVRDLPFGVIVVDRSLKVSDWNGWMERVTGLTRGQVQGRELDQFLPDLPDHDAFANIHSVFENGRLIRISSDKAEQFLNFAEVPNHSKVLPMIQDTELRPLFDFEGEVVAVCIIIHDVTERVLRLRDLETLNRRLAIAHRALEEANRVKSDFLANTSHELRTPLTSILGFVEILENDLAESRDEEKSFLANIRESAQHLLDLINNILRTAEIEAGKFEMNLRGLNLGEVLSEVLAKVHPVARHKGIEVTIEFDDFDLVQDTRFQALMPDPLHFLGVTKIHNFISMSDMKYNAIVNTGIKIVNRIEIPKELVPLDAQVEITAKVFHGYNAGEAYKDIDEEELKRTKGRDYAYDNGTAK